MSRPSRLENQLLDLTRKIVEAEVRAAPYIAEVNALKKRFSELLAASQGGNGAPEQGVLSPELGAAAAHFPKTLMDRVESLIDASPMESFTADKVSSMLGLVADDMPTLRSALVRLFQQGRIERPHRGEYRAVEPMRARNSEVPSQ